MKRMSRRDFFTALGSASLLTAAAGAVPVAPTLPIRAIAFDAFPILDPRPVFALARQLFPKRGDSLVSLWRGRQFEYTWLRSLSHRYVDFWQVTEEALAFAAKALHLNPTPGDREQLMSAYLNLACWPEVPAVLRALKNSGLQIAFLSNMTEQMLIAGINNSGLSGVFDYILSSDRARTYKPDPRAYQIGIDALNLQHDEILFVASAGWDAAGARSFGFPTYWVNRENQPSEQLGFTANASGATLNELAHYLRGMRITH